MKASHRALFFCVVALCLASTPLMANEKVGILFQPGIGVDREFSDDMTEVLANEMRGRRDFFFIAKEELRVRFERERKGDPDACAKDIVCLHKVGQLLSLDFLVAGTISKQGQMYKIEMSLVSMIDHSNRFWTYEAKGGTSILVTRIQNAVDDILSSRGQVYRGQDQCAGRECSSERRAKEKDPLVMAPVLSVQPVAVEQSPLFARKGTSVQRILAYSTASVAVVAAGVGGYFLWKTKDIESFLNDNCSNSNGYNSKECPYTEQTIRGKISQGKNSVLLANVFFGAAGAAGVGSVLLLC